MTSKNNQNERLRKISMEDKRDRFSIRKLAIGAASILLGFSFMAASGQVAKADTTDPNSQETSTETSKQTTNAETETDQNKEAATTAKVSSSKKSKTDVTTYAGLHSFLRGGSEETEGQVSNDAPSSETENTNQEQDNSSEQTQPASAEDLANAAADLQTEIGKGHSFVATPTYQQAAADKQQAVTDAIAQGQTTLDKYNHFVSTNDEASKISLFDLTDAKVTIGAMITAATNTVGTQNLSQVGTTYGGWRVQYNLNSHALLIDQASNAANDTSEKLADFINTNGVLPSNVNSIEFYSDVKLNPSTYAPNTGLLGGFDNLTKIKGMDHVTVVGDPNLDMSYLFANDPNLSDLDLSNFTVHNNVINMAGMFYGDEKLLSLDLSKFDTSQVTDMSNMFANNNSLTNLKISSNFKTNNVSSMKSMFQGDRVLTSIPVDDFVTSNVEDMSYMFSGAEAVTRLNVSNFTTNQVKNMAYMFENNQSLTSLDISNFNTSLGQVTNMESMFAGDKSLTTLNLGNNFDTSHVGDDPSHTGSIKNMFSGTTNLKHLLINGVENVINFRLSSNNKDLSGMFNSTGLESLKFDNNFNTSDVTNMSSMFNGNHSLTSLSLGSGFLTPNVTDMSYMFSDEAKLTELDIENFRTDNVTNMSYMFANDYSLKNLDLQHFNFSGTNSVESMLSMAGDTQKFVLTLPRNSHIGDAGGTNSPHIGDFMNFARDESNQEYQPETADDIDWLYDGAHGTDGSGTPPSSIKTYTMVGDSDNNSYSPNGGVTLMLHAGQKKINMDAVKNILKYVYINLNTGSQTNYDTTQLMTTPDAMINGANIIQDIVWKPGHKLPDSKDTDNGDHLSATTSIYENIIDTTDNNIWNDIQKRDYSGPTSDLTALAEIKYGDNTFGYVKVKFNVVGVKAKLGSKKFISNANSISSGVARPFSSDDIISDYIDLNDISGQPVTQPTSYSVSANNDSAADVNIEWSDTASTGLVPGSGHGEVDAQRTVYVTVNYGGDTSQQKAFPITVPIESMEKASSLTGFKNQQTYPIASAAGLMNNLKASIQDTNAELDDIGFVNGSDDTTSYTPNFTSVGTQCIYVKVPYADSSYKVLPVIVQVIAQPKPGIYDDVTHPGNIGVPQYTDIGNDQQVANNAAASASVPAGTTASWGDNTLPNTNSQGNKGYHFINVTYPDGSTASIPININVGNAVTKDITLKHNAYIYGADGKRANGITLKAGSTVTTYGTKLINGREFYLTKDADYYLAAGNDKPAERNLVQDANVYSKKGKKLKTVKHTGTTVKTYGAPILIKGKEYYSIGKNRYISKDSFPPTPDTTLPGLNKGSLSTTGSRMRLKKNTYLYDEKGQRANSLILKSGSIIQTHGSIQINGKSYYAVDTGEYINAKNVDENWLG